MSLLSTEKFRPHSLKDIVGQEHLLGKDGLLYGIITEKKPVSLLFWGPPGCGKTTVARIYAESLTPRAFYFSATNCSAGELKELFKKREAAPLLYPHIVLFMDEIHRFNKSQQDFFLPYLENGSLVLIAATTENPSFHVNGALLSRLRTFSFKKLSNNDLESLILSLESQNSSFVKLTKGGKEALIRMASGDARCLIHLLDSLSFFGNKKNMDEKDVQRILQKKLPSFDKSGDFHYDLISALQKSIRGSDPDAALFWLARMLRAGEDPLYISRRLIRMASEDVGLADPDALPRVLAACESYRILGSPEGEEALAQAAIYLALAPKSNSVYKALQRASLHAEKHRDARPPSYLTNHQTPHKEDYSKKYVYDHDTSQGFSGQSYFPEEWKERPSFYVPGAVGFEREMIKRLNYFSRLRRQLFPPR